MKSTAAILLTVIMCFVLASCGKADPIVLPDRDNIANISVVIDGEIIYHEDSAWIDCVMSGIADAEPTSKESVHDVPQVDDYIKLDIQLYGGVSTVFAYEEYGKYYIEQPYQGIYELDSDTYSRIIELGVNK